MTQYLLEQKLRKKIQIDSDDMEIKQLSDMIKKRETLSSICKFIKTMKGGVNITICDQLTKMLSDKWSFVYGIYKLVSASGHADAYFITTFITIAGNHQQFGVAKRAFARAEAKGWVNNIMLDRFIDAAINNSDISNILTLMQTLPNTNLTLSERVIYQFIRAATIYDKFREATEFFKHPNILPAMEPKTVNYFLTQAKNKQQYLPLYEAYDLAIKANLIDEYTYIIYIEAMFLINDDQEVRNALISAIKNNKDSSELFNKVINVAGEQGNFDLADQTFNYALKSEREQSLNIIPKKYNSKTFGCYIKAAKINKFFKEACDAFKLAEDLNVIELPILNVMIGFAMEKGKKSFAEATFKKYIEYFKPVGFNINFHGYAASTVNLTMNWLLNEGKSGRYLVITGRGNHSKNHFSPVIDAFQHFCATHNIPIRSTLKKTGACHIDLSPEFKRTIDKSLSSTTSFFLNSNAYTKLYLQKQSEFDQSSQLSQPSQLPSKLNSKKGCFEFFASPSSMIEDESKKITTATYLNTY